MYQEIQQLKEKVSNIGGDYYYLPDDGTGELIDSFETYNSQNWEYLGQLLPRYTGMVTIKNMSELRSIVLVDLFSTFSNYQYGSGSGLANFNTASAVLSKNSIRNPIVLSVFYPQPPKDTSFVFPVIAGIPVFIYSAGDGGGGSTLFKVEMRAKKVAK